MLQIRISNKHWFESMICEERPVVRRAGLSADAWVAEIAMSPASIQFAPLNFLTEALCAAAVDADGTVLRFVPSRLRTRAVCLAAAFDNRAALEYVPEAMRTPDFYADLDALAEFY